MKTHSCYFVKRLDKKFSRGSKIVSRFCVGTGIAQFGNWAILRNHIGKDRPTHRGGVAAAVAKLVDSFVSVSGCVCVGTTPFVLFRLNLILKL